MSENYKEAIDFCFEELFDEGDEHLSDCNIGFIPSKEEVCDIVSKIKKILYPKYFWQESDITKEDCKKELAVLCDRLQKQVELALYYRRKVGGSNDSCEEIKLKAKEVVSTFVKKLPEVFELLRLDVQATLEGDPAAVNYDIILLTYPGIEATYTYRLAHILFELDIPLIPRIMTEFAHSKTGIDIHPGATIGKSFVIDHGTGVVIGETTEIGNCVKLYQGVTLGAISLKNASSLVGKKRHPTLKDNVTIYSGATVLGGETVLGEGAVIGSSVFITHSVEAGTTVAIEKPKLRLYTNNPIPPK